MSLRVSCWCYCTQKMTVIEGEIVGKHQAELLKVIDCTQTECPKRGAETCLIGKLKEGRWR